MEKDGGRAFPMKAAMSCQYGMTLRDYFAAKAMYGILNGTLPRSDSGYLMPADLARDAYRIAEAMLDERERIET